MKQHLVYQIHTNNMIYVGVTNDLRNRMKQHEVGNDQKGRTMRKYGYTVEVLFEKLSKEEAYAKEAEIVNEEFLLRKDTLNKTLGGVGSFDHINNSIKQNEYRKKQSKSMSSFYLKNPEKAKEMKEKEAATKRGKTKETSKRVQIQSIKISGENNPSKRQDVREKISKTLSGRESPLKGRKRNSHIEVTCPHCGKTGEIRPMKAWHFDKCKKKIAM